MKKESGVTLLVLIITVIIMIMLSSVVINYTSNTLEGVQFQNFNYELQQIQGKVDMIYEKIKLSNLEEQKNYITVGSNITDSAKAVSTLKTAKGIDYDRNYASLSEDEKEQYYYNYTENDVTTRYTTYRFITETELKEKLDITSKPGDVIINFQTREVVSVNGFEYKGQIFYTRNDN